MTITQTRLKELLHYEPSTGVFTWKRKEGKTHGEKIWNGKTAGKRAGSVGYPDKAGQGYARREIRVDGKLYKEHRLAFLYMTGGVPEEVDHDNRDATDNRWCNLVGSTHKQNGRNQSMPRNNTSGVCGVYWNKGRGKWQAFGKENGNTVYIGLYEDLDVAAMEVLEFRSDRGYHPTHGLEMAHYHREVA